VKQQWKLHKESLPHEKFETHPPRPKHVSPSGD